MNCEVCFCVFGFRSFVVPLSDFRSSLTYTRPEQTGTLKKIQILLGSADCPYEVLDRIVNNREHMENLARYLRDSAHEDNQIRAAVCLANLAAGNAEHTKAVAENAPTLINEFLSSKQPKKVGVAMWTLGNIAGDKNLELNQNLIAMGFIEPTLRIFASPNTEPRLKQNCAWALTNLLQTPSIGSPLNRFAPSFWEDVLGFLSEVPAIHQYEACWLVSAVLDQLIPYPLETTLVAALIESLPRLQSAFLNLMKDTTKGPNHHIPILKSFMFMQACAHPELGPKLSSTLLSHSEYLEALRSCLSSTKLQDLQANSNSNNNEIHKLSACILSNITAEREEYRSLVANTPGLLKACQVAMKNASHGTKKELIYFFTNMIVDMRFTRNMMEFESGTVISEILGELKGSDIDLLLLILTVVEMVVRTGWKDFLTTDVTDKIEEMQYHRNNAVAQVCACLNDLISENQ